LPGNQNFIALQEQIMSKSKWIGEVLGGRYQLEALLGQGGMSAVYRAKDPNLRRTVAIKLIHSHLAADPEFVRRFEGEAAAVARLRHPHIVQVFDFNHDDDVYFMVLEYVPGETLQDKLRTLNREGQLLPVDQIVATSITLSEAVQYAHSQGMIHRDLKPANIMITPENQAVLMDFGIAKIVGGENLTATGAMIGTVSYMSPEQIRGQRPDHRADIYALGVILFEMTSGRRPFEGDSAPSTMMMHLTEPVPDLRQINQNIPLPLVQVIEKSLAKDPNQRYQTAAELAAALRAIDLQAASSSINTAAMTMVQPPAIPAIAPPLPTPSPPVTQSTTGSQPAMPAAPTTGPQSTTTGPHTTPPPPGPPARSLRPWIFAGVGLGILGLLIVICGLVAISGQFWGSGQAETGGLAATQTSEADSRATIDAALQFGQQTAEAAAQASSALATQEMATAAATQTAQASSRATVEMAGVYAQQTGTAATAQAQQATEQAATYATTIAVTPQPTATYPPTPENAPTLAPTQPSAAGPMVRITRITLSGSQYEVYYETTGYTPALPGQHIHFFFNTVRPEDAGSPGPGPWELYAGPVPFTRYGPGNRPAGATQMCALVANSDHSIILNTGNCVDLP
jgi:serine/threonine protein kinase